MRTLLGSLEPRFFGINIAFEAAADLEFTLDVYSGKLDTPALAKLRSQALVSDHQLWLATAVEHELRHYHDSLISAHWLAIQALRNQSAINVQTMQPYFIEFAKSNTSDCFALPFRKWLRFGKAERQMRANAWPSGGDVHQRRVVPLPIFPLPESPPSEFWPDITAGLNGDAEHLAGLLFQCMKGYDRIDELNAGRASGEWASLRPSHVYELSALIAQLYAAHFTFDERAAHDFRHSIGGSRDYSGFFNYVLSLLLTCKGVNPRNVVAIANGLATWAILGPPDLINDRHGRSRSDREIIMSCPAARFAFGMDLMGQRGVPTEKPAALFEILDENAGTTDYKSAIDWLDMTVDNKAHQYKQLAAQEPDRSDVATVSNHFETYRTQRRKMVQIIRSDPEVYADPHRYMSEIARFPRPITRIDLISKTPIPTRLAVGDIETHSDGSHRLKALLAGLPDDVDPLVIYDYERLQLYTDALVTGKVPAERFAVVRKTYKKYGLNIFRA